MSKYTTRLKDICTIVGREELESWFKSYNISEVLTDEEIEIIENRGTWNKDKLARMIVNHFYMSEIGFETIALFKHFAIQEMEEIMEEYLPLIYSNSIKYNPLINVDYKEVYSRVQTTDKSSTGLSNSSSNSTLSNTSNGNGLSINSKTPQGQITKSEILSGKWASETIGNESTSTSSDTSSNTNSITSTGTDNEELGEAYTKTIQGNSGVSATSQKMIEQYRDNIRAINTEIIDRLNVLFMAIF